MQKLENINTTQIVTESVETKQVITESKTVVKESAEPVFKSSIARGLVEEFGYELEEDTPPAPVASPWANDPAKDAAWKALSPEDQKWLGGADPTDQFILARAPNKGAPAKRATGAVLATPTDPSSGAESDAMTAADQADADLGAAMRANAAGGNSTSAATGVGNPGEEAAAQAAADAAGTKPADAPADAGGSINPATLAQYKALLDKLKASQGSGAATKPAVTPPKKPTQIAPASKQPAATMPNVDQMGNPTGVPTKEGVTYGDDQILTIIKSVKY